MVYSRGGRRSDLRSTVGGVREWAEEQWDMVVLLLGTGGDFKDDLDIRVEVAADAYGGPVV